MMNQQIKEKWIAALRSGEYNQSSNKLRSTQGFCCLGVLCDLYAKEHNDSEWEYRYENEYHTQPTDYWYFNNESELLPQQVKNWAELSNTNPSVEVVVTKEYYDDEDDTPDSYWQPLSELNDEGESFNQIASMIESSL